jgi:hypothetical protein
MLPHLVLEPLVHAALRGTAAKLIADCSNISRMTGKVRAARDASMRL